MPPKFAEAVEQTKATLSGRYWRVGVWHGGGIEERIEKSKSDYKRFSLLRLDIAHALEKGRELSRPETKWLIGFLNGTIKAPRLPVGAPKQPETRLMIFDLVGDLVSQGMRATRNDTSPPTSACDAVAQAIREEDGVGSSSRFEPEKAPTSYERVKRIWLEKKKSQV